LVQKPDLLAAFIGAGSVKRFPHSAQNFASTGDLAPQRVQNFTIACGTAIVGFADSNEAPQKVQNLVPGFATTPHEEQNILGGKGDW
jgi:hypothetical protein